MVKTRYIWKKICSRLLISHFAIEIFPCLRPITIMHSYCIDSRPQNQKCFPFFYTLFVGIFFDVKKIFFLFFFFFNRSISNDTGLTISSISLILEINHHDFQIHCVYRGNWQHRRKIIVPWKSCLTTFKRASLFIMAIYVHDIFNSCLERSIYPYPDQWLINQYFLSICFITITIINSFSYLSLHRGKRLLVNV